MREKDKYNQLPHPFTSNIVGFATVLTAHQNYIYLAL